ncbi:MAG: hypothetical protein J7L26_09115 [Candidatus Aminicenantes bacterium]|nr:hypothetical protein [Candidatus Aminicenantes bacterium]
MNIRKKQKLESILKSLKSKIHKDEILYEISFVANVAQFVSFSPGFNFTQRYCRIRGVNKQYQFDTPENAIKALLESSPSKTINIRSFDPQRPKEGKFIYGLKNIHIIMDEIKKLAKDGFFTIANETIDINDGGISGVSYGDVLEFSPKDTPKCVDKPGICSLPFEMGIKLLKKVYNFKPDLDFPSNVRVEFSIHPIRQGYKKEHTVIWELESDEDIKYKATIKWPNNFSRFIGDKAFGLLLADILNFSVPNTLVIGRNVRPFRFGKSTRTKEYWIRTSPPEPVPGRYGTVFGWQDPFNFILKEDPEGQNIASLLVQEAVESKYSGAALIDSEGKLQIEGVKGKGDKFMLGLREPDIKLPGDVVYSVKRVLIDLKNFLGPIKIEWVNDRKKTWIVQLHLLSKESATSSIFAGEPELFYKYNVNEGLEGLRELIAKLRGTRIGIELIGNVGILSHFGDLLRRAKIPSRIKCGNNK